MYYAYGNFRPPFPAGVPMIPPQGSFVPGGYPPMFLPVQPMGPDMRPPMYPPNMIPAPYGMVPAPPGWYENMSRPLEMSAQDFQDEEMDNNDEAEEITH
jgi:hypothetical protein